MNTYLLNICLESKRAVSFTRVFQVKEMKSYFVFQFKKKKLFYLTYSLSSIFFNDQHIIIKQLILFMAAHINNISMCNVFIVQT